MSQSRTRNNTVAGFFVLATVALFLAVVVTLSGMKFGDTKTYIVGFPVDLGTPGLARGSDVTIGMTAVGRVESIETRAGTLADPVLGDHIRVEIKVNSDYVIAKDARAGLVVPLLGSGSVVNFDDLGSGNPATADDLLTGGIAPPLLLRAAGIGNEEIESIKRSIAQFENITANVESITAEVDELVQAEGQPMVDEARATLEDVRAFIKDINARKEKWINAFDNALANINEMTESGKLFMDDARGLVANTDEQVTKVGNVIDEVRPDVATTTANAAEITTTFKEVTMVEVNSLLDRGNRGVDDAAETLAMVRASMTSELPSVSHTLGNMRIASDNLKLAMIEIRSAPWKLLYKPSTNEYRSEMMHDAVRTYANAVSDLNAATASLKALQAASGPDLDANRARFDEVLVQLETSFTNYKEAEQRWFQLLLAERP